MLTGVALVAGYALLGTCWLILKTDGPLQQRFYRAALWLGFVVVALIGVVSIWTPFLSPEIAQRWFSWPNIVVLAPIPLLVVGLACGFYWSVKQCMALWQFLLSLGFFVVSYAGLGISMYPYVVPRVCKFARNNDPLRGGFRVKS